MAVNEWWEEPDALIDGFGRLSSYPDDPLRAWVQPGCRFHRVECRQNSGEKFLQLGDLDDADVIPWLQEAPEWTQNETPAASVKILVVDGTAVPHDDRSENDITRESTVLKEALRAFGLAPAALNLFGLELNEPTCKELLRIDAAAATGLSPTMHLSLPYHGLIWRWDEHRNCTYAIIRADDPGYCLSDHFGYWVQRYQHEIDISLLIPYLLLHIAIDQQGEMVRGALDDIQTIEAKTDFHSWTSHCPAPSINPAEIGGLSFKLSGLAATCCSRKTDASTLQNSVRSIQKECDRICNESSSERSTKIHRLKQCLSILDGILTSQLRFCEEIKDRATIQQTALITMIQQQDRQLHEQATGDSRLIALASKHESASVKTLAVMSVLFLPGIFVATVFAMPMLGYQLFGESFWTYLVITIPLTSLVLVTCLLSKKRGHVTVAGIHGLKSPENQC